MSGQWQDSVRVSTADHGERLQSLTSHLRIRVLEGRLDEERDARILPAP